jgi:predicted amidohydrolase YtcJ
MRAWLSCCVAIIATAALTGCTKDAIPEPGGGVGLIIRGGTILTMDPSRPRAEAIAISGDQIDSVGAENEVMALAGAHTVVVDLDGATLMPGFVDAHSHYFGRTDVTGTDVDGTSQFVLGQGVTTTGELYVDEPLLAELRRTEAEGDLGVRVSAYLAANNGCGESLGDWWQNEPPTRNRGEMLRIGGVKVFTDGGSCNRPAVSFEYADGGGQGDLYYTVPELAALVQRIEAAGHQAAVHALGDRAIETALGALDQVIDGGSNPHRHRIEHSAATRPDLRARHGEVGVVTTLFGTYPTCFFTRPSGQFKFRTPPEYLEWEWPWRSLLDQSPGARFAWHGDFPVFGSVGPVDALYGFVTRAQVDAEGSVCEPTPELAANAITVDEALALMTTGSAYALGREDEVGRLAPGMLADLVVLSADPTAVPPADLKDLEVWMTMIGGRVGWCRAGHEAICPTLTTGSPAAPAPVATSPAAPVAGGTNLARAATATASAELPGQPASLAIDGDPDTSWSSGSHAPQWIQIDLGSARAVSVIRLTVAQFPDGATTHRVAGGADATTLEPLGEIAQSTQNGQTIEIVLPSPTALRLLRIETTASPSWVSWSEIEVLAATTP